MIEFYCKIALAVYTVAMFGLCSYGIYGVIVYKIRGYW